MTCIDERLKKRIPLVRVGEELNEYAIIELQGEVKSKQGVFDDLSIGPLKFDGDHATLIIGNHLLRGKVHKLKKPLAVLERAAVDGIPIIGVVRSKVVFSERSTLIFEPI